MGRERGKHEPTKYHPRYWTQIGLNDFGNGKSFFSLSRAALAGNPPRYTGNVTTKYHHLKLRWHQLIFVRHRDTYEHTHKVNIDLLVGRCLCEVLHCSINRSPPPLLTLRSNEIHKLWLRQHWMIYCRYFGGAPWHMKLFHTHPISPLLFAFIVHKRLNVISLTHYRTAEKSIRNVLINVRTLMNSDDNRKGSENENKK